MVSICTVSSLRTATHSKLAGTIPDFDPVLGVPGKGLYVLDFNDFKFENQITQKVIKLAKTDIPGLDSFLYLLET